MKKALAIVLALAMALTLVACGGTPTSSSAPASASTPASGSASAAGSDVKSVEGMTVTFIPKVTGNAFFEVANDGAQKYAEDWGITVDYQGSATAAVADQVQVINTAVASGTDAICISTVDAAGVSDALKAAAEAASSSPHGTLTLCPKTVT